MSKGGAFEHALGLAKEISAGGELIVHELRDFVDRQKHHLHYELRRWPSLVRWSSPSNQVCYTAIADEGGLLS